MIIIKSLFCIGLASLAAAGGAAQTSAGFRQCTPNIVLILMDDMGYGDFGRTGANQYDTPNIVRLANQGMQFTWYYTPQAVCSASRAGLMTGCYPNRIGISASVCEDLNRRLTDLMKKYKDSDALAKSYLP